ncbi:hypothetical protein HYY72_02155 [Candidatus Woesearchaeota archaeon]|nr:hypothetical protein [Candidatus Woesearchaeota archaeon]
MKKSLYSRILGGIKSLDHIQVASARNKAVRVEFSGVFFERKGEIILANPARLDKLVEYLLPLVGMPLVRSRNALEYQLFLGRDSYGPIIDVVIVASEPNYDVGRVISSSSYSSN